MEKKYLLGLDIGTNSVGWCVTDENYNITKKNGKSLWGVRMFDEAKSAKERRTYRTGRRRLQRRKLRIDLLQEIFDSEISKVDDTFFMRLNESRLTSDDKSLKDSYLLFNDFDYSDKDYYKDYPTIRHLIKELIEIDKKADIRKLYLACAYLIKYRGHFLIEGDFEITDFKAIKESFSNINEILSDHEIQSNFPTDDEKLKEFVKAIQENNGVKDIQDILTDIASPSTNEEKIIIKIISGSKSVNIKSILDADEEVKMEINKETFEEDIEKFKGLYPEYEWFFNIIVECKCVNDFIKLNKVLKGKKYLYEAMIEKYDTHKSQLKILKNYIKSNYPEKYDLMFSSSSKKTKNEKEIYNYSAYIGLSSNKKRGDVDEFYKFTKNLLGIDSVKKEEEISDPILKEIYHQISTGNFLPLQSSSDNGIFPNQLNIKMLDKILDNQTKYYGDFLNKADSYGSNKEKIRMLLTFRVPYYVGPLYSNEQNSVLNSHSWSVRKEGQERTTVTPWNFKDVIDEESSAEKFILRMTNKCTYLRDQDCLPKKSLLYCKYEVLNELNNLLVNGEKIRPEIKSKLFEEVYLTKAKVTRNDLIEWFKKETNEKNVSIVSSGKHEEVKKLEASMSSYVDFSEIFGSEYVKKNRDLVEKIIRDITIFEDKRILRKRLNKEYLLTEEQIEKIISKCQYKGWGKLSKKLLLEFEAVDENGEIIEGSSIIKYLWETSENFQSIIYNENYHYQDRLKEYEDSLSKDLLVNSNNSIESIKKYINESYVSPLMKRALIQSWEIIIEVEKIIKHPIDEFYIECTREHQEEKAKNLAKSRKEHLKSLISEVTKSIKGTSFSNDIDKLQEQFSNLGDDNKLLSDRYYLYFSQLGRCMYTGKKLDLNEVKNANATDIDHIYPQSKIKDDSLLNNKVLVLRTENAKKSDKFPYEYPNWKEDKFTPKEFFGFLMKNEFINEEKYHRLTRKDELTDDEIYDFVNRQLVITNQSVKALADSLRIMRNNAKVVFSKASYVSSFRQTFDLIKCREANNYHHAHDAYLNIVVGRVIDQYFSSRPLKDSIYEHIKNDETTNPDKIFEKDLIKAPNGFIIWDKNNLIKKIKHYLYNQFDILTTTRAYEKNTLFHKASITSSTNVSENVLPLKSGLDPKKYGGYSDLSYGLYILVESLDKKNNTLYTIEAIPNIYKSNLDDYVDNILGKQLNNPRIILPLKVNTILTIGKCKFCITGKTDNQYVVKNLVEPNFAFEELKLIKLNEKELKKISKSNYGGSNQSIANEIVKDQARSESNKEQKLNDKSLNKLFELLIEKLRKGVEDNGIYYAYSNLKNISDILQTKKNEFYKLDLLKKIKVNHELIKIFECNNSLTSDLRDVGLNEKSGKLRISKNITKLKGLKIIGESVTGFFSKTLWCNS